MGLLVGLAILLPGVYGRYTVRVDSHSPNPILSKKDSPGKDCIIFNPSFIPASETFNRSGLLVRQCCGSTCTGHGRRKLDEERTAEHAERIGFAECKVVDGTCGRVNETFNLDPYADTEDPRAFFWEGWYYLFYYRYPALNNQSCVGEQCTVQMSKTRTPLNASSWIPITTLPWHRNGCCLPAPKGEKTYCMWGEGPGPFPGLGMSYTTDIDSGIFERASWHVDGDTLNNASCPLSEDKAWLLPLGANLSEIKLEAGTHLHKLHGGDVITFYAAATPGWVANGNYTVGWLVLDGADPTRVLQRSSEHLLVPTFPYETLCEGEDDCPFVGERKNVIFVSSAVELEKEYPNESGGMSTRFRLFFGGGDGNVGTAVVSVATSGTDGE